MSSGINPGLEESLLMHVPDAIVILGRVHSVAIIMPLLFWTFGDNGTMVQWDRWRPGVLSYMSRPVNSMASSHWTAGLLY